MVGLQHCLRKINGRPSLVAFVFSLCLTAAESFAFQQNYSGFFQTFSLGSFDDARDLFFVCFAFAALFFFVRSMLVSNFRWRCVYFAVFAFAVSVEYGFYGALERFTLPSDAENAFYASDSSDKFGAITLFFSWLAFVPIIFFRLLFLFSAENAGNGAKLFVCNLVFILTGCALSADFYRTPPPANAFAAHFNNIAASALYFSELRFSLEEREQIAPIETAKPRGNIVFIVDESVRADHLSVNGYERETTPTLESLEKQNLLVNWGAGVSGATESVGSNRLLLTGLNDLPARERQIRTLPTIFQYARAAGYQTFYFDGQDYSEWIGSERDRQEFGRVFTAADFPELAAYDLDRAFAGEIRRIVGESTGNFIWVNKRGVHFRYEKNYPAEKAVWTPTGESFAAPKKDAAAQALINNYDNAIYYNSESFFQTLVGDRLPAETVFVYTSDHGQTLSPHRATHAGESPAEALVPILMIGEDARLRGADTDFSAAHGNLFATLLDLMNYPKNLRAHDYALSLFEVKAEDAKPRTYFVGNLSGAFGGRKMFFDERERGERK